MPVLRKVYNTGSATVIGIPVAFQDLTGLSAGATASVEVTTPELLLRELGVAPSTIDVMGLPTEHFLIIRKHEPG